MNGSLTRFRRLFWGMLSIVLGRDLKGNGEERRRARDAGEGTGAWGGVVYLLLGPTSRQTPWNAGMILGAKTSLIPISYPSCFQPL
jgi:hypothetical protein